MVGRATAFVGENGNLQRLWLQNLKKKTGCFEDLGVVGIIRINWVKQEQEGMAWTGFT
jgi:hypothetical protein